MLDAFSMTLTTPAFDRSRSWWFATRSCKPMARGHTLISYAAFCGTLMSLTQTRLQAFCVKLRKRRFGATGKA